MPLLINYFRGVAGGCLEGTRCFFSCYSWSSAWFLAFLKSGFIWTEAFEGRERKREGKKPLCTPWPQTALLPLLPHVRTFLSGLDKPSFFLFFRYRDRHQKGQATLKIVLPSTQHFCSGCPRFPWEQTALPLRLCYHNHSDDNPHPPLLAGTTKLPPGSHLLFHETFHCQTAPDLWIAAVFSGENYAASSCLVALMVQEQISEQLKWILKM